MAKYALSDDDNIIWGTKEEILEDLNKNLDVEEFSNLSERTLLCLRVNPINSEVEIEEVYFWDIFDINLKKRKN